MILGCVQPTYLAWIPFFERMQMSDVFVYLDDVQFVRRSPHSRNKIKLANGPLLLTVPVLSKGHRKARICDIKINHGRDWARSHWRSIELNYRKARCFEALAPLLQAVYSQHWEKLADLSIALIELFKDYLGLAVPTYRSSELAIQAEGNEKLVKMCQMLGATKYIVKPNTEHYHPKSFFEAHGISFEYIVYGDQEYEQLYGEFMPGLSILDYAMNCGPNSLEKQEVLNEDREY